MIRTTQKKRKKRVNSPVRGGFYERQLFQRRSAMSRAVDRAKQARPPPNLMAWRKHPGRYDLVNVDSPSRRTVKGRRPVRARSNLNSSRSIRSDVNKMNANKLNEFSSSADKERTRKTLEDAFNENAHRFQKGYDEGTYTVKTQGSMFIASLQSEEDYAPRRVAEINFNTRALEKVKIKVSKYNTKDYMEKIIEKAIPHIEL